MGDMVKHNHLGKRGDLSASIRHHRKASKKIKKEI